MAFDQDSLNASVVYDIISGNERNLFRVNAANGVIYLEREIDLEEESLPGNTFVLQIEARQKDSPLKRALARYIYVKYLIFCMKCVSEPNASLELKLKLWI